MNTYLVYLPPAAPDPQRAAIGARFVRDGFAFWAFVAPLIWLPLKRMWLVFAGYLALTVLLEGAAMLVGGPIPGIMTLAVALLFGLEANALHGWTLERKGWTVAGLVAGRDRAEAERRFFDRLGAAQPAGPGPSPRNPAPRPVATRRPALYGERPVTGLFSHGGPTR